MNVSAIVHHNHHMAIIEIHARATRLWEKGATFKL